MTSSLSSALIEHAAELAQEGLEYVMAHGLVRYRKDGSIGHLPFTLHPWEAPPDFYEHGQRVSPLYNKLYFRVAQQREFLDRHLAVLSEVDDFIQGLYSCLPEKPISRPWLFLNRHDFMPAITSAGIVPKQVETNLMAASLGYGAQQVNAAIRYLYAETELGKRVLPQRGGSTICKGLALGYRHYAQPGQVILFIVPPGEVNAFDQRSMQAELVLQYDIPVVRATMDELGEQAELRDGYVFFKGRSAAIAYFRGGYSPVHYADKLAWKGRRLLEHSQTLSIPSVTVQLANTKKIQQVLSQPAILQQFVSDDEARQLLQTMVTMIGVDELWEGSSGRQLALKEPHNWVLKPSREGGGNNYFAQAMVDKLQQLGKREAEAFILMQAIHQQPFRGVRMVEEKVIDDQCVTELGHFTYALWDDGKAEPVVEEVEGYLQRTKHVSSSEGLVLGGYSYLDTTALP